MSNINIGTKMRTLDVGQKQATYTGVIVHSGQTDNGQSIDYTAGVVSGDNVGSVLEVTVPNGSYELACALLSTLKLRGYQYQPFEADGAIADPSIEIGDNITANGVSSIVMGINTNHSRLMASTLKAPFDEEVNHEWTYEPRSERQFKRESAYTRSRLTINENAITAEVVRATNSENVLSSRISITADNITAEVARATAAEGSLRSAIQINADNITAEVTRATTSEGNLSTRITQNADNITAEVTRATNAEGSLSSRITQNATDITAKVSKTAGSVASFGWTLTDSSWSIFSNNSTVLSATSEGLTIKGSITATSGYIGTSSAGFAIDSNNIKNGMTSRDDTDHNGIYIGTDGIALGGGKFKVTSSGGLTAKAGYIGDGTNGFAIGTISITNGMTSLNDTTNNGVYVGTNGIALGAGAFKVTSTGSISANNMTLTGTLNIGGTTITATELRTGAQKAYDGYSGWDSTSTYVGNNGSDWTSAYNWKTSNGDYCVGGAGWGYNFGSMDDANNSFPINASSFRYGGTQLSPQTISFVDGNMNVRTFYGVMMYV